VNLISNQIRLACHLIAIRNDINTSVEPTEVSFNKSITLKIRLSQKIKIVLFEFPISLKLVIGFNLTINL
jgi:hypothetical protein